jgi:hypothetical protein
MGNIMMDKQQQENGRRLDDSLRGGRFFFSKVPFWKDKHFHSLQKGEERSHIT